MAGVPESKSIKELSDAALALYNQSLATYHELNLHAWERATGAQPIDANEVMKDLTTLWGTAVRDVGNLAAVWQQVARIAAPGPAPADGAAAEAAATPKAKGAGKSG